MSVKCGKGHEHQTVDEVRACYGANGVRSTASHPTSPHPASRDYSLPDVPAGYFATPSRTGNNDLDFWEVQKPTEGRWAGRTFIHRMIGGHDHGQRIPFSEQVKAAEAIVKAGPASASATYGQETGHCGTCGRLLTDEASRARGIGPVCAAKEG